MATYQLVLRPQFPVLQDDNNEEFAKIFNIDLADFPYPGGVPTSTPSDIRALHGDLQRRLSSYAFGNDNLQHEDNVRQAAIECIRPVCTYNIHEMGVNCFGKRHLQRLWMITLAAEYTMKSTLGLVYPNIFEAFEEFESTMPDGSSHRQWLLTTDWLVKALPGNFRTYNNGQRIEFGEWVKQFPGILGKFWERLGQNSLEDAETRNHIPPFVADFECLKIYRHTSHDLARNQLYSAQHIPPDMCSGPVLSPQDEETVRRQFIFVPEQCFDDDGRMMRVNFIHHRGWAKFYEDPETCNLLKVGSPLSLLTPYTLKIPFEYYAYATGMGASVFQMGLTRVDMVHIRNKTRCHLQEADFISEISHDADASLIWEEFDPKNPAAPEMPVDDLKQIR